MNIQVWLRYVVREMDWECPVCGNHNKYNDTNTSKEISKCKKCNLKIKNFKNQMGRTASVLNHYTQPKPINPQIAKIDKEILKLQKQIDELEKQKNFLK